MRIVSLLPATTEWVAALGALDDLVGRSHACDYPPAVQTVPTLTRASFTSLGDSAAIDDAVQHRLRDGLSLYDVDLDRLHALHPDVILTQAQCEVCAVSLPQIEEALGEWVGVQPKVVSIEPQTLKQVLDAGLRIGQAIGRATAAMQFMGSAEQRLSVVQKRLGVQRRADSAARPTVACVEWLEPLMIAGHWMPDVVEQAGGRAVLTEKGAPSQYVEWNDLRAADPDVLAILPCGFTLEETTRDLHFLTERDGWSELTAVNEGRVVLFDGNAYFNRPGPRVYRAIELLATAIHPDALSPEELSVADWEMVNVMRDV